MEPYDGFARFSAGMREAGFTVALAGTGGDEIFGGYKSFRDLPRAGSPLRATKLVPEPLLSRMAKLIVISWRDVPSQVVVKQGRETVRVQLSARFQEAVDRAAMRAGKGSSDAYIADWKRSEPRDCGNELKAEAIAEVARLEATYSDADLEKLIRAKGVATLADSNSAAAGSERPEAPGDPADT